MNSSQFWGSRSPERMGHARIGVALLALILAWLAPAPAIAQATCGSYAVAVAPQPVGHPLTDNIVRLVDSTGELAQVTLAQPGSVTPSPRPGVALLRSLGSVYSLLDTATNTITPIAIPEDQQAQLQSYAPTILNAPKADFMLMANFPTATWLVDLRSGQAIDLTTLLPNGGMVEAASIAPGGKWLQFYSQHAAYVISLETPAEPVSISDQPLLPYPGFDSSGEHLIYAQKLDSGIEVHSLDLATGTSALVGKTPSADVLDATTSDTILLIDKQRLLKLDADEADATQVFTWKGVISGLEGNSEGTKLLIGDALDEKTVWSLLEIGTGSTVELTDLTDMTPLTVSRRQDAVVFLPSPRQGAGTPGAAYRTLDLSTGQVSTVLTQDSTEVWTYVLAGDASGRFALIDAVGPGQGRMWLIDAQQGSAVQIGTSSGNLNARVSPDGCQIAMSVFDTVGEGRTSVVTVTSLVDGSAIATLSDSMLLGWAEFVPAS